MHPCRPERGRGRSTVPILPLVGISSAHAHYPHAHGLSMRGALSVLLGDTTPTVETKALPPWLQPSGEPTAPPAPPEPPKYKKTAESHTLHDSTTGRFVKGTGGRPKGSRNKVSIQVDGLLDGEAETITRKCISLAMQGDATAMRICMDRIAPVRKGRAIPKLERKEGEGSVEALLRAVLDGEITPDEGQSVVDLIESAARAAATQALGGMRERQLEQFRALSAKTIGGTVMLVPLVESMDSWESTASEVQLELRRKVRE
jgi:hypothetical protein